MTTPLGVAASSAKAAPGIHDSTGTSDRRGAIVRSGAWSSLTQLAPAISAVVLTPYVVVGLGADGYGLYVLAITLLSFLGSFDGGLTASAGRYFSVDVGTGETAHSAKLLYTLMLVLTIGGGLAAALVAALAPALVGLMNAPAALAADGAQLIRVLAVSTVCWLLYSVCCALCGAHGRFAWTSLAYVAGYLVLMAGMAWVLAAGGGLREVAWVLLAQAGTTLLLVLPAAARLAGPPVGLLSRAEARRYAHFASRVQMQGLAWLVNSQAAMLISGLALRVREVGVYGAGANLALQLRFLPMNGLRPIAARLGRDFGEHGWAAVATFERLQLHWVRAVTGWSAVALGSVWFAVQAWLGPAFADAGTVACLLVLANAPALGGGVLVAWLNTTGHAGVEARCALLSVVLNLTLIGLLVHPLGVLGAALAVCLTQWVATGCLLHAAARALPHRPPSLVRSVPWAAAAITVGMTVALEHLARPYLPGGGAGLVLAGLVAAPAGIAYCGLVYRPWLRRWR